MNTFKEYGFVNGDLKGEILKKVFGFGSCVGDYVGYIIEYNSFTEEYDNIVGVTWNEFGEAFIGNRPKSKYNLIKIEEI